MVISRSKLWEKDREEKKNIRYIFKNSEEQGQ